MKTIMITGASRGIGFATAKAFAEVDAEFDNIVLVARDSERLEKAGEVVSRIAGNKTVIMIASDLGIRGFQKELFDRIEAEDLSLTTILNNAGYTAPCPFNEITDEDLDLTLQINVKAPLLIVREARLRGHPLDYIVNIASTAGLNGRSEWATYSASKAAILAASESMGEEFRKEGTEVLRISPGRCATDLRKRLAPDEDPSTIMQPEEVADGLRYLLSDQGKIVRHQNLIFR